MAESKDETAVDSKQNESTESGGKEYQWDINGDMKMHWETGDDYKQYVQVVDEAYTIGSVDDKPFVSVKSIFPSREGWPMEPFTDTNIIPWHFDCEAELDEAAKDNNEHIYVWGNLQNPIHALTSEVQSEEDFLSYFLHGELAQEANEGTLVTTGLRTKELNGHTIKYVRMQFEHDTYRSEDKTVTLCVQCTRAMTPVKAPDGKTYYLDVQIDEYRQDPETLSDDSIVDLVFENVVYGE